MWWRAHPFVWAREDAPNTLGPVWMARYLSETSVFLNFRAEIPRPRLGDLGIQLQRSERNRNCEALHAKIGTDLQRSVSLRMGIHPALSLA
jgi:hypothetical protein